MTNYDQATIQQILAMGEMEAQDEDLQRQIAMAEQLRMQQGPERQGALAGGIQAAADILRAYKGKQMEGAARGSRQGVQGAMTQGRNSLWSLLQQPEPQPEPQARLAGYNYGIT
jgi:hypothetical protein